MEKVSIIVPIYNVENFLPKCLNSIVNQTYEDIEIILIDDGSTDKSGEIAERYACQDTRIVVVHKNNGGLSDARNAGIETATGKYLMFIDGDDYVAKKMVEVMYSCIVRDGSDMVMCGMAHTDEEIAADKKFPASDGLFTSKEFVEEWIQYKLGRDVETACNKLYKKSLFDEIRFPIGKQHEDVFVAHYIVGKCNYISVIREPLYYYVRREGSITRRNYSVKKLDCVEALLDRVNYALNCGENEWAVHSLKKAMFYMMDGYRNLKCGKEVKERVWELKHIFNKVYFKILMIKDGKPEKIKILFALFFLSPRLLVKMTDIFKNEA